MRTLVLVAMIVTAPLACGLSYRVDGPQGGDENIRATIHARRIDGVVASLQRKILVPSSGTLPVTEGEWELRIESDRVWAAPAYTKAGEPSQSVVIVATPAGQLRASLAKRDASTLDTIRFLLTQVDDRPGVGTVRAEVTCPVREGQILCTVPAGLWDLRIDPAGFVPQFRWNVAVAANAVREISPVALIEGAAVIGRVARAGRGLSLPADTSVRLVPSTVAPQDAHSLVKQVKPNAKGFFEFSSVPPGEYFVSASAKALTSDFVRIEVIANRTAEIKSPLLIDVPRRLKLTVIPSVDPEGKPWLVSVSVRRQGSRELDSYTTSRVDADGVLEQKGLRDGEYLITVERVGEGGQWASQWVTLNGDLDVRISVPLIKIAGQVSYGNQPLAARLTFGGEFGRRRQLLTADADGHFVGVIPEPEDEFWDVYIEDVALGTPITVHEVRGTHRPDDSVLYFDFHLPRTAVFGSVVLSDGTPAPFALVRFKSGARALDTATTAKDGTFQVLGLPRGAYEVLAEGFLMTSEVADYSIQNEESPPLRLTLRDAQQVRGRIVTSGGVPVIGASIGALPVNTSRLGMGRFERTNERGAFLLQVRQDVHLVDLLLAPPGFATVIARTPVRADRYMEITVDQLGGSLVVDLPPDSDALLSQDEATWSLYLVSWASLGTDERLEKRRRITVPSLRAGQYSVCLQQTCKSGYVPPHGLLQMSFIE
jgi:hypothetical protein